MNKMFNPKSKNLIMYISIPVITGFLYYYFHTKEDFIDISESSSSSSDSGDESENPEDNKIDLKSHYFNTTPALEKGFKNVKHLHKDEIGVFDMGYYDNHSMWMQDTLIPLDIIFLDSKYKVIGFIENAEPLSEKSLFINKHSYYVVETNAGFCKARNIYKGMNFTDKYNLNLII